MHRAHKGLVPGDCRRAGAHWLACPDSASGTAAVTTSGACCCCRRRVERRAVTATLPAAAATASAARRIRRVRRAAAAAAAAAASGSGSSLELANAASPPSGSRGKEYIGATVIGQGRTRLAKRVCGQVA